MNLPNKRPRPTALIILDGWGVAKPNDGNAISQANKPFFDDLLVKYPSMIINASEESVGLPARVFGNSEVGHLNLGAGRVVYQDIMKINKSIEDGSFFKNKVLSEAIKYIKDNDSSLHIMGLVSDGQVHSSIEHLFALLELAKRRSLRKVYIHCFLDGRDTGYQDGVKFVQQLEEKMKALGVGKIASVSGRYYAMDRDNHWERILKAYGVLVEGKGPKRSNAIEAIKEGYNNKNYDEEFIPTMILNNDNKPVLINNNDAVIFFNYRADRAREITKALVLPELDKFKRGRFPKDLYFVSFTEYEKGLPTEVAFPKENIIKTMSVILAENNLKQFHIAETEKYAHVTYFFNGGSENKSKGEDHALIPSPRVASYDLEPEMSAALIADRVVKEINDEKYDFILINFANPDMVGHTGNLEAGIKAIEAVDHSLEKVIKAIFNKDGVALVTADHGNAEEMLDLKTNTIIKEHSTNPVPLIFVGKVFEGHKLDKDADIVDSDLSVLQPSGALCDIAPTVLKIMNLEKPVEMTGKSLI
ncbi:MAG: 2,3-bisphosphoglycerate-independent phosphoglycerate mutase [bacterium]